LHPHLKRGLVYDEPDTDPADAIEHAPRRQIDPEEQAAKRQRIAEVASQYLRGRMPVIMTASLRGPFNHGWKNPWAEDKKPKRKPRACGVPRHKAGSSAHIGVGRAAQEPTRPTRSASRTIAEAHTIASPETSRAADTVEDHQESHTLDVIGPATAPSPPEQASSTANSYSAETTRCGSVSEALPRRIQHNLVASPALNSSSGFVYKKVGTKKWTLNNAPRSKPRAVNFNSSPANKGGARSKPNSQNSKKSEVDRPDEALDGAREVLDEQQSMGSTRSSGQSAMSTQAAMILAQLEFQESTFPTSSVDSSRPWSQSQEATPRPVLPEPSPAITPLSVFRPQLDQGHVMTSVLQGPMMSTQDLFAAASPFAMSTIKKKSAVPEGERSYLGTFTTSSTGQDDDASDLSSRSPMSLRNQIQQAEKKAAPSPRSFGYDKGPRKSQCSSEEHTRYSISDVELPQLDLKTSLDGYGSNGSVHFADRFLRTFNDT
ncbi:hypothetical protein DE146DRAFT_762596, partial [Phaeosphaeria sp. MPI-PUGE-AT-0046c]